MICSRHVDRWLLGKVASQSVCQGPKSLLKYCAYHRSMERHDHCGSGRWWVCIWRLISQISLPPWWKCDIPEVPNELLLKEFWDWHIHPFHLVTDFSFGHWLSTINKMTSSHWLALSVWQRHLKEILVVLFLYPSQYSYRLGKNTDLCAFFCVRESVHASMHACMRSHVGGSVWEMTGT